MKNTAKASANGTDSNTDDQDGDGGPEPGAEPGEDGHPGDVQQGGRHHPLQLQGKNTGNVTLYNITVTDNKATVTCPETSAGLAPLGGLPATPITPSLQPISRGFSDQHGPRDGQHKHLKPDSETVTFVNVPPGISVTKTANPTLVPETGGNVTFTFVVTNNAPEPATITGLSDSV